MNQTRRSTLPLLALSLLALLGLLPPGPAQAQSPSLTKGEWRRALLSQSGRTVSYSFTAEEATRVGVVSLSTPVAVDIAQPPGTPECGVAGDPRFFQNIACDDSLGTYTITITLDSGYTGNAISVFVRYDNQSDLSYTPITATGGPYNFTVAANSIKVFSFNYSSGPSRQCVSFGNPNGLSHAFSTRRGALLSYNLPGDAKDNENPSYRLETGNSPHYLIVANSGGGGVSTSLRFFGRTSSRPC